MRSFCCTLRLKVTLPLLRLWCRSHPYSLSRAIGKKGKEKRVDISFSFIDFCFLIFSIVYFSERIFLMICFFFCRAPSNFPLISPSMSNRPPMTRGLGHLSICRFDTNEIMVIGIVHGELDVQCINGLF